MQTLHRNALNWTSIQTVALLVVLNNEQGKTDNMVPTKQQNNVSYFQDEYMLYHLYLASQTLQAIREARYKS